MKEKRKNYVRSFNRANWLEKIKFKTKGLFSGDPKLTVKVDRNSQKIKIVRFDSHFKLMAILALFFIICWGYCLFKAITASEINNILRFGIISLITFAFASMIIRRAVQYEKDIFSYIDNLVRHGETTSKLFSGMLAGSSKEVNDALQKINEDNEQGVKKNNNLSNKE